MVTFTSITVLLAFLVSPFVLRAAFNRFLDAVNWLDMFLWLTLALTAFGVFAVESAVAALHIITLGLS